MTASLFQPEVWQFEVAPWPERIFNGHYPKSAKREDRKSIPPAYATELQTVMNTLNDLRQDCVKWDCGTTGLGVVVSDSLMFQRGEPTPSDPHLGNFYGLAMPLIKRGLPVTPAQLENFTVTNYLDGFRILLLSYDGQKPMSPEVHGPLAEWVKQGGVLVMCDADADPYLKVREWWNSDGRNYATPREHLFEQLGLGAAVSTNGFHAVGRGGLIWLRERPASCSASSAGAARVVEATQKAAQAAHLKWREGNYLLVQRGPYVIAAGLDESVAGEAKVLRGRFVNLFDSELRVVERISVKPGDRYLLRDLDFKRAARPAVLASACKALETGRDNKSLSLVVEGVAKTPAVILLSAAKAPKSVALDGESLTNVEYSKTDKLLWIRFGNEARPRKLQINF